MIRNFFDPSKFRLKRIKYPGDETVDVIITHLPSGAQKQFCEIDIEDQERWMDKLEPRGLVGYELKQGKLVKG